MTNSAIAAPRTPWRNVRGTRTDGTRNSRGYEDCENTKKVIAMTSPPSSHDIQLIFSPPIFVFVNSAHRSGAKSRKPRMSPKYQRRESRTGRVAPVIASPIKATGTNRVHAKTEAANNLRIPDLRVSSGPDPRTSTNATTKTCRLFATARIMHSSQGSPITMFDSRLPRIRHANRAGHSALGHFSTTMSKMALTGHTAAMSPVPRVSRIAPVDSNADASTRRTCAIPGLRIHSASPLDGFGLTPAGISGAD